MSWFDAQGIESLLPGERPDPSSRYPYYIDENRGAVPMPNRLPPGGSTGTVSPSGGSLQSRIQALLQSVGGTATPEALARIEPQLNALGVQLQKNSAGEIRGRLYMPDGAAVDVVNPNAWGTPWTWRTGGDPLYGKGGTSGLPAGYQTGTFTGGGKYPLASVMGPGLMQPWTTPYTAPTVEALEASPGFQARLKYGQQALERGAAANGTLLTGGTQRDLQQFGAEMAANEYDRLYGRALGEYQMAYGIYGNNQANQFNRLNTMVQTGAQAAAAGSGNAATFGQQGGNTLMDIGNATAAGQAASGAAWGSAIPQSYNDAMNWYWMNRYMS